MACRPVFVPAEYAGNPNVQAKWIEFEWFPGMSKAQKQRSIEALHSSAKREGIDPVLEISTKSPAELGVKLSAFNLMIETRKLKRRFSVEVAFQSSKVFERGGPYTDLIHASAREAKKDRRLVESGRLISFEFFGRQFPLEPTTFFYDWLYVNALHQKPGVENLLGEFDGFTDIEFNPKRSINCQAFSAALFMSLVRTDQLAEALGSPEKFREVAYSGPRIGSNELLLQKSLL